MPAARPEPAQAPPTATLIVTNPSGNRTQVLLRPVPFRIGRLGENHLALRDSRISRHHAQIVAEAKDYIIEDLDSRHGVYVNGVRVKRQKLRDSDRIEFGFPDSYQLTFALGEPRIQGFLDRFPPQAEALGASNLTKLRALVEAARALQTSLSTDEVLAAVVEAALTVTGCERGFLLLRSGDELEIRVARDRSGPLPTSDLRVPTRLLLRALNQRRDFLFMTFDPAAELAAGVERTVADLELTSVVCVPMVRIRTGSSQQTTMLSAVEDTVGLLYMDSRKGAADLSVGSRELLTTLALEASTVLENARLLEEQWARQRMEEELKIARRIQESLLPRKLPSTGWFRACGSSIPSREVGGDCYVVRQSAPDCWAAAVVDVSGKGVGAALLAALLEGMFLAAPHAALPMEEMMGRINRFLSERTEGEQYATIFFCTLDSAGRLRRINAGHPPPCLVRCDRLERLPARAMPVGLLDDAVYEVEETQLEPGDKLVIYTDGLSEARNPAGEFFGLRRIEEILAEHSAATSAELHEALIRAVRDYTEGADQLDDIALLVLEYAGQAGC